VLALLRKEGIEGSSRPTLYSQFQETKNQIPLALHTMPIICFGPICIPISALWPVLILLVKPLWKWIEAKWPWVNDLQLVKSIRTRFETKAAKKVL
jgi:hypothetical protein